MGGLDRQLRERELLQDSLDLYHWPVKAVLLPMLLLYVVSWVVGAGHALTEDVHAVLPNVASNIECSGDVGLCMTFRFDRPLNHWLLRGHAIAAVSLVALVVAQKELVRRIAVCPTSLRDPWRAHRKLGYLTLATMLAMNLCGYLMGPSSSFESFQSFIVLFAAPWVSFAVLIVLTGRGSRRQALGKSSWVAEHRLVANMLLKAALSTPLSRLGGSILQRQTSWSLEAGYYVGIFSITAVVTVWQLVEICIYWQSKNRGRLGIDTAHKHGKD
jgi:hypothetical protein